MARALQYPRAFDAFLTDAKFARSRESHLAAGNVWPGDLLSDPGNLAIVPSEVRWIALQPTPATQVATIAVLARDCELIDSYIRYRTLNVLQVNAQLATYKIIVRNGVLPNVATFGLGGEPGNEPEGDMAMAAQVPVPVAQGEIGPAAALARGWAVMLHWRAYFIAFAFRWGRRR